MAGIAVEARLCNMSVFALGLGCLNGMIDIALERSEIECGVLTSVAAGVAFVDV